jgi:hypothetical protein
MAERTTDVERDAQAALDALNEANAVSRSKWKIVGEDGSESRFGDWEGNVYML